MSQPNPCRKATVVRARVGESVDVEKAYALAQHSPFSVLSCPPEFFKRLTIPVSISFGPMSHEIY